jgi:predicted site-specific integrase-resolvase
MDSKMQFIDRVVLIEEAGAILGISRWTLLRQSEAGKIKILKLSPRRLGIRMSEINRYLDENVKPMKAT